MKLYEGQYIVVTGGAGFIGSAVIRYLNNRGLANIIVVDEFDRSEKWKNLVGKQFIDIVQKEQLFSWLQGKENLIEAFIHLGACSSTVETDSGYLLENNYRYSVRLAEYALTNNHRFIYASSAATYGDGTLGFLDDHDALESLRPLNMYGYSKHLFDLWAKQKGVLSWVVGLKYFNVFGPNEWHKGRMASAIANFYPMAKQTGQVSLFRSSEPDLYPDGGQKRDFIYVKDVARITCAFLENEAGGIFNVGTGRARSWNDLANALFKALKTSPTVEYISMPEDLLGKYQNYTCADVRKLQEALGQAAECAPLEKGVVDYIRKHLTKEQTW